jgi:hypothetical protein
MSVAYVIANQNITPRFQECANKLPTIVGIRGTTPHLAEKVLFVVIPNPLLRVRDPSWFPPQEKRDPSSLHSSG